MEQIIFTGYIVLDNRDIILSRLIFTMTGDINSISPHCFISARATIKTIKLFY